MASVKFSLVLLLACTLFLQGVLADIICENLPTNVCAFSISSSGKRCLLENSMKGEGKVEYQCKTSEVVVGSSMSEYLETDECVKACGVDRKFVGMSSDALLEPTFTAKLCSPACYNNCPNIVDLYFNLAAGEGVYLPDLCAKQRSLRRDMIQLQSDSADAAAADAPTQQRNSRRGMVELLSSDAAAPSPISSDDLVADALTQSNSRRAMVELLSSGVVAPSPISSDDLAVDAPTQRNSHRAMVELLSSGAATPSPIFSDDLDVDTPAPSPFYF